MARTTLRFAVLPFALVLGLASGCGDDAAEVEDVGPFPGDKVAPSGLDPSRAEPASPEGEHLPTVHDPDLEKAERDPPPR